jgi:Ni,Fe-hydrogenase I small subunit
MDYCKALREVLKHNIVWVEAQSCSGETVMILKEGCEGLEDLFFHSSNVRLITPTISEKSGEELIKEITSLEDFVLVVEGAIPKDERACWLGEFTCAELIRRLAQRAKAVVAVGSCAVNGGILRELGSIGVGELLSRRVYEVPGCPASDKTMVAVLYSVLAGG